MTDRIPETPREPAPREQTARERWRRLREKHAESQTIFGIAMAGIAALFIMGIVAAFQYAASTAEPPAEIHAQSPAGQAGTRVR